MLNFAGLKLAKQKYSQFEYLLSVPRYKETIISLFDHEFTIADSHSFYYSHREIFLDEIYKFLTNNKQPIIIDCGANYGTSIVYFKRLYPDARIVGVEADPYIYKILEKNIRLRSFKDIILINKAVYDSKCSVEFHSEGADGGRVYHMDNPANKYEITTIMLDDIVDCKIDFMKLDIEGAEANVLLTFKKIREVKMMFIEYHSFSDSKQKLSSILDILTNNNFRYYIQSVFSPYRPFIKVNDRNGMDLQLNIFAFQNS
ncbi:MAG: FkbM family methyltransferase [Bacteroidetes bacterium]|nr:FkbM family methyltransferase [Bacteroidota bacterium]